jgi:hypothetical protein
MHFVYCIEEVGRNRVKIGTTTDLKERLKTLATGNSDELRYVGRWPGGYDVETLIHDALAGLRGRGEWFHLSPELARSEITRLTGQEPYSDREIQFLSRLDLYESVAA